MRNMVLYISVVAALTAISNPINTANASTTRDQPYRPPQTIKVSVPDVRGLSIDEALSVIRQAGLSVTTPCMVGLSFNQVSDWLEQHGLSTGVEKGIE